MDLFDFLDGYSDYKKIKKTAQYLETIYDSVNNNCDTIKVLKEFTPFLSKMDVVRYNQDLYDKLQGNGWDLDLLKGKFIKSSLK